MKRCGALGFLLVLACEPQQFQTLEDLTVVAVEVSPPSANPGDTVSLELTLFDPLAVGSEPGDAGATEVVAPQIAWFGGCHNPPGESATGCLPLLGDAASEGVKLLSGGDPSELDPDLVDDLGVGPHFEVQIPHDPVSDRRRRPELVPFGVSYAFFAVCRGQFALLPEARERLPVGCVDERGHEVNERDFILGFTTIYVYDEIASHSPHVRGVALDGERVRTRSCDVDRDCAALGRRLSYDCEASACVPVVPACSGDCSSLSFAPLVDANVGELDPTSVAIGAPPDRELVWVKYYAVGALDRTEALIADRAGNLRTRFAAEWTPPARGGRVVPLWAVVQDSRGGTTPTRIDVKVE